MTTEQQGDPSTINISIAEYNSLLDDSLLLEALDAAGVDNWEGYAEAHEIYEEAKAR